MCWPRVTRRKNIHKTARETVRQQRNRFIAGPWQCIVRSHSSRCSVFYVNLAKNCCRLSRGRRLTRPLLQPSVMAPEHILSSRATSLLAAGGLYTSVTFSIFIIRFNIILITKIIYYYYYNYIFIIMIWKRKNYNLLVTFLLVNAIMKYVWFIT